MPKPPENRGPRESSDGWGKVVVQLSPKWRVIECRDGVQWILQRKGSVDGVSTTDWTGRSYCRTKEALLRLVSGLPMTLPPEAKAILDALPDWTEGHP